MLFFKSLCLAILATLFITYTLGVSFIEIFDIDVYMGEELVEPLKAISISAVVMTILVLVALVIVLSVFGSLVFIGLLILGGGAMLMIGTFWPVLLVIVAISLYCRDKKSPRYQR